MSLTGRADGPALLAPPGVVERMTALAASLAELSDVAVDGPALLGERAALAGLSRQGATSCGGATRLLSVDLQMGRRIRNLTIENPFDGV